MTYQELAINGGPTAARDFIPPAQVVITDADKQAVLEVLDSGMLAQGRYCAEFAEAFREKVGARWALTVSNGTSALHAAYTALFGPGDEVIVPAITFFATASMVCWTGAKPVFADIDPRTYTLDPDDVARKITPLTKAIVGVHLFGNACPIGPLQDLAEAHGLKLIWDAAQAHLTTYDDLDVGSFGDAVTYSFYATKNMTTGEGGMVTSPHEEVIKHIEVMRKQGQVAKYVYGMMGTNYRMTDMEAALGLSQLARLSETTARRREIAAQYDQALGGLDGFQTPVVTERAVHSYHLYTATLEPDLFDCDRDEFADRLRAENIGIGINYPQPLHTQKPFDGVADRVDLPVAEAYCRRCLSLPVYPSLTDPRVAEVIEAVKKVHHHSLKRK